MDSAIKVAAVVGPTASGKTRMGVALAKMLGGEVISADSMQIYKGLDIGTAKPTAEEMDGVPHHLVGFLPPEETFSAAQWCEQARGWITKLTQSGKLPIIVGGTGLYVSSLLDHIEFSPSPSDEALRAELTVRAQREGGEALLRELSEFDPASAARLHPNNIGRIVRAIELYRLTGVTMTEQLERSRRTPSPYRAAVIGLSFRDRAALYRRIDRRVDEMVEMGLVEEARAALSMSGRTAAQAIGYKELKPYFDGEATLAQAIERLKMETRRYAKRQLTWFRRDERVHWIYLDEVSNFDEAVKEAKSVIEARFSEE